MRAWCSWTSELYSCAFTHSLQSIHCWDTDTHSDGTHSLQIIHCWDSDAMLHFSKPNEETNSSTSWMAWGWVHFHKFSFFGLTIYLIGFIRIYIYLFLFKSPILLNHLFVKNGTVFVSKWPKSPTNKNAQNVLLSKNKEHKPCIILQFRKKFPSWQVFILDQNSKFWQK